MIIISADDARAAAGERLAARRTRARRRPHRRGDQEREISVYWYLFSNHCTRECIHKKATKLVRASADHVKTEGFPFGIGTFRRRAGCQNEKCT